MKRFKNLLIALAVLAAATFVSLLVGSQSRLIAGSSQNTQMVFILAVLVISRYTSGYFWGLFSAVISVPLVNYMFTYPFFAFNLSISGYVLTFLTMLTVSLFVSLLTSRVQQQEQLRLLAEKEKLRANLLRAVSHDLRTPLTSIVGATGAILESQLPPEKQHDLLEDVNADAQWLLRMVENLLTITRMNGSAELRLETEVVEDVLAEAVIKFQKHFDHVEVQMDMGEDVLLADMDAVLIEQVVCNILENAVYHGKHTTQITVQAQRDGADVLITIADNGAGIPRDKLAHLFTSAIHSGEGSLPDTHKHMGIGLSACKSIIKAHGGRMTARNNENGGACFYFTLPEKENEYGCENPDC